MNRYSTSLNIGGSEISIVKENVYTIESSNLILDSINENITRNNKKHIIHKRLRSEPGTISKENNKMEIEFEAYSVMPLTKFLAKKENKRGVSYDVILHFIGNIGNQLTFLKNEGFSIPFFSLEDIIVIDDIVFAFVNNEKVFTIGSVGNNNNKITIDYPIIYDTATSFIPPNIGFNVHGDLTDLTELPLSIHFSSAFYSLAQLVMFIFFKKRINTEEEFDKESKPFIYTSIYWCLKRCLNKDENKRILLYV